MQAILRFLRDWREAAKREHTERWVQGSLLSEKQEQEWAARCSVAEDISTLNFDTLKQFYDLQETSIRLHNKDH
jgi:hypothetical protein